ncbi:Long-chain fatty acid transport protein 1-like protein, partial [Leptotrombidium deliense]
KHPQKFALISDESKWTFKQFDQLANQIANFFTERGLKAGDEVALFMPSKPEHVIIWYGLSRIGVVTGLINENLKSDPLVHSITCIRPKALIFDSEFEEVISDIYETLNEKQKFSYFYFGDTTCKVKAENLKQLIKEQPDDRLKSQYKTSMKDSLCYIYTSGTTGFPKAAIVKQSRVIYVGVAINLALSLNSDDIVYNCLPLYHTIGVVFTLSQLFFYGRTIVIRRKFSASKFWDDCIKYNCTVSNYIGEVTSYLLAQPPKLTDKSHRVRKLFGAGLRQTIWKDFVNRFQIKDVFEVFGSTEGNTNMGNLDSKDGSCGFVPVCIPKFIRKLFLPLTFIKVEADTGEVIRDENGFCIECKPGDSGMLVAKIDNSHPSTAFEGYVNKTETEKKILRDVFKKGDAYFSSGDVLYMDEFGYFYFKDRIGDTFRWKGENVSTNEVEGVIAKILNVVDCVVYGVQIPYCDGKAGMVAIATKQTIDFANFYKQMNQILPKYAVPLFVRFIENVELTGTFRFSKVTLKKDAFDINVCKDQIYVINYKNQTYEKLTYEIYEQIVNEKISF